MLLVVEQMRSPTEKDKASFSGTGSLYAYPPTQKNSFTSLTSGVFQLYFDCSTCLARWLTSAPRKGGFGRKSFFFTLSFFFEIQSFLTLLQYLKMQHAAILRKMRTDFFRIDNFARVNSDVNCSAKFTCSLLQVNKIVHDDNIQCKQW